MKVRMPRYILHMCFCLFLRMMRSNTPFTRRCLEALSGDILLNGPNECHNYEDMQIMLVHFEKRYISQKKTNSPLQKLKFVTNEGATALTCCWFCSAWLFASVKSNQARRKGAESTNSPNVAWKLQVCNTRSFAWMWPPWIHSCSPKIFKVQGQRWKVWIGIKRELWRNGQ